MGLAPGLAFVWAATHQPVWARFGAFHDDAFYYFGIAANLAHGRGSTFNGIDSTNGYHPLWLILLTILAAPFRDRSRLLIAATVLESAVWAAVVVQLYRIGRLLRRELPILIATAGFAALCVLNLRLSFNGMESGIAVLALVTAWKTYLDMDAAAESGGHTRHATILGLALTALVLSRLDYVFVVVALVLLTAVRSGIRKRPRVTVRIALPPVLATVAYMAYNAWHFATPLPVSGRAKALGAPFWNPRSFDTFLKAGGTAGHDLWLGAGAAVLGLAAWIVINRSPDVDRRWRPTMRFTAALWLGTAAWLIYLTVGTSYELPPWYMTSLPVLLTVPIAVLADAAGRLETLQRPVTASAWLLLAVMLLALAVGPLRNASIHDGFVEHASTNAKSLDTLLEPGQVLAMGDRAGALGYAASHPLVQLEGLVESDAFLDAETHRTTHEFLAHRHVEIYLRCGGDPPTMTVVQGQPALVFVEPFQGEGPKFTTTVLASDRIATLDAGEGERLDIFRYRPGLNP